MESMGATELHVDKSKVYGRSFKDDMDSFYNDISLRNALAVFGRFTLIKSARHLADIKGLSSEEAVNSLECLQNLGLVKLSEQGYELTSNNLYRQTEKPTDDVRRKKHAEKLLQVAGMYETSEDFSDTFGVLCTSKEIAENLKNELKAVINKYADANQNVDEKDKNIILNVGVAFTTDHLKNPEGEN